MKNEWTKELRKSIAVVFVGMMLLVAISAKTENWSENVKIESIQASQVDSLGVWVTFSRSPFPNNGCSETSGKYVLGGSVANIEKMTTIATAALVNSRYVSVYWSGGCSGGGTSGYPVLIGLTIK